MKKVFFLMSALLLISAASVKSQVTIGSLNEPHEAAVLDLDATTKGLLLPNVFLTDVSVFAPLETDLGSDGKGMLVYNTNPDIIGGTGKGLYVWDGSKWNPLMGGIEPKILTDLPAVIITPTSGTFCNSVSFKLSMPASGWTSTEWNSLSSSNITATLAGSPYPGNLTFDGTDYYYSIAASGTGQTAVITVGGDINSIPVMESTASVSVSTSTESSFSVGGINCFDIAYQNEGGSCGSLASRLSSKADFTKSYTYTLAGSLGGAAIQDVVWSFTDPTGAITSFDPAAYSTSVSGNTVSVQFDEALSTTALGETGIAVVITATVTTTSGPCDIASYTASRTVTIKDCYCGCPVKINASDYITMKCYNLGVEEEFADWRVPSKELNGNYYQWGRTAAVADVDNIIGSWSASPSHGVDHPNWTDSQADPCDDGWRLPTCAEWVAIGNNNTFSNNVDASQWAYDGSFLRGKNLTPSGTAAVTAYLPAAGYRTSSTTLSARGYGGFYWSSTQYTLGTYDGMGLYINSSYIPVTLYYNSKSYGLSVRCVAE